MPAGVDESLYAQLAVLPPGAEGSALVTFPEALSPAPAPSAPARAGSGAALPRFSPAPQARPAGVADSSLVLSSSLNVALLVQRRREAEEG